MKRYALILLVLLLAGSVRAQQREKNILGVRAGLNISKLAVSAEDMPISIGWRTGFRFAVSDQVLLTRKLPLYLETGVDFSSRGGKIALAPYGEVYRTTPRPFYLQVPLLVNCHFNVRDRNIRFRSFSIGCPSIFMLSPWAMKTFLPARVITCGEVQTSIPHSRVR